VGVFAVIKNATERTLKMDIIKGILLTLSIPIGWLLGTVLLAVVKGCFN
jgi:hypothetical protein